MNRSAFDLARQYGVRIEYADLGDWGMDELRSEYDPSGPVIRVNQRVIDQLPPVEAQDFIAFAVGHEMYHHREHCGEIPRLADRAARETAANDFARKPARIRMRYFAGIDGGQSQTAAVIGDEYGTIAGRGIGGAADEVNVTPQSTRLRDAIASAIASALAQANLPPDTPFVRAVAGISGYEGKVYGAAPQITGGALTLMHDAPIAHAGAFAGGPGVVVIAGTGSVAYAVNERGEDALTGGWGYVFGDAGGGFWIARTALSSAMDDNDAGEPGDLAQLALQNFNAPTLRALARAFYTGGIDRTRLAWFASAVIGAAEGGNEQAAGIIKSAAAALVMLVMRAAERVALQAPRVAFTGGLTHSGTFSDALARQLRRKLPQASPVRPRYDPAAGALLLAYKQAGIAVDGLRG